MTVDVNVKAADEEFLDDIDEIMEDTMVQMFFLQPQDRKALEKAKEDAGAYNAIFYAAPLSLKDETDANCIGYRVKDAGELLEHDPEGKPLFVDESDLDDVLAAVLVEKAYPGIILNATKAHETLESFRLAIGPSNVDAFDPAALAALSMDRIVLQSGYPEHGFDAIQTAVKRVSDAMFRPEQSIIARATLQSLTLAGFKK